MSNTGVQERVISLLEKKKPIPLSSVEEKLNYYYLDEGHIDSFGVIELIMDLEQEFNIKLDAEILQSEEFKVVGGIVTIIEQAINKG